jgi:O-antigen/teichoic acid export membrane protein
MEHMNSSFILLFLSLMIFGGGPYFRGHLRSYNRITYERYSILSTLQLALFVLTTVGIAGAVYYAILVVFLMIGGPLLFIYAYSFKNDIRGPWDIPNVKDYEQL